MNRTLLLGSYCIHGVTPRQFVERSHLKRAGLFQRMRGEKRLPNRHGGAVVSKFGIGRPRRS